ncbi:MAG: tetratricopeptide repeat protein [Candidatus Hodarchaeota archaeon]
MPRPVKTRVCSETEKRKAELFNCIDDLIITGRWSEASENLQYLYRTAPSVRTQVQRKLAWLYFEMKNHRQALAYLQDMLPTNEAFINRMVIESLLSLNKKDYAIFHLAKAPLTATKKQELFFIIFPELKNENNIKDVSLKFPQVTIRCPKCARFLFFTSKQPKCLFCDTPILNSK